MPKLTLLLCIVAVTSAQDFPGLKTGDRIPPISLVDQSGATRTFEQIKGPKGALLVFYRSADW